METTKTHVGKIEARLKQLGAKLDELVARADDAGAAAKVGYRERVTALKAQHHAAQAKLEEAKTAGAEKWENFKTGVEGAWHELETAFADLKN